MSVNYMEKWEQERKEAAVKGKAYLLGLMSTLKTANVTKLIAHYDGQGDSGQFEYVHVQIGDDIPVDADSVVGLVDNDRVINAAYDVLEEKQGGWEINEGSFGDVVLYVETGKIVIEHNHRIEDSEYSEHEV